MSYSGDDLIKLGQKASFLYFTENVPLGDSVLKIASTENLNPEQVKRVCESANKSTMIQIYKSDSDNCCSFKVASAKDIVSQLSKYDDPVGPVSMDYYSDPPSFLRSETKIASVESMFKSLVEPQVDIIKLREQRHILTKTADVLKSELEQATGDVFCEQIKYAGALDVLYNILKQGLMKGKHSLQDFFEVARSAVPGAMDAVKSIFSGLKEKLSIDPSVPKNALTDMLSGASAFKFAEAVDEKYISKAMANRNGKVPMRIINGRHPVIVQLKVIIDSKKKIKHADELAGAIRNKLSVVRGKLEKVNEKGSWS